MFLTIQLLQPSGYNKAGGYSRIFYIPYLRQFMHQTVKFIVRATTAATLLALGSASFAAPEIGANIELDNTHRGGSAVANGDKGLTQSGRVEISASGKAGTNMFVAGKSAFVTKKDGTLGTDDMWIQLGSAAGDVKLGRFESADLFPLAGDTLVNHAGNVYGANTLRGRKASDVFHAQGTINLGAGLSFELGLIETTNNNIVGGSKGTRPVLAYASGPVSARVGFESGEYASGNRVSGYGITGSYDFGGFKLTANLAHGKQDSATTLNQSAVGLSATVGSLGLGFASGTNDIAGGDTKVQTVYASYNIPLFDVKGASITPAFSSSTVKNSVTGISTDEAAFRVRLNYAF
jgi:hypothetical protein